MADRRTLHINKLEDFKKWLVSDGWSIEKAKGDIRSSSSKEAGEKAFVVDIQEGLCKGTFKLFG